jgi:hypothetical protein
MRTPFPTQFSYIDDVVLVTLLFYGHSVALCLRCSYIHIQQWMEFSTITRHQPQKFTIINTILVHHHAMFILWIYDVYIRVKDSLSSLF